MQSLHCSFRYIFSSTSYRFFPLSVLVLLLLLAFLLSFSVSGFLGVGKHFRLLMQSCRFFVFFSPHLFTKISNFSKTVHTKFIKVCSHSTLERAPACAKASKFFDWNVRNIAKISPKISIFRLFSIFSKAVHTIRTKFSTVILNLIRVLYVMASKTYRWDVRNIAQINPKMVEKQPFFDFFRFSQRLSIRVEPIFVQSFYAKLWSFKCNFIKF